MTHEQPHSLRKGPLISPVKAPESFGCMFCAESATGEPSIVSATAASAVNGGATTTSTSRRSLANATVPCARSTLERPPWNIFQLPAMSGRRDGFMGSAKITQALPPENLDAGQLLPLDEL